MSNNLCAAFVAASMALTAAAEGYQVNSCSAKQLGMGHVGTAMVLGAESTVFNPAALAFCGKTLEVSASVAAIKSTATALLPDGGRYQTSSKVSTPMEFAAAFRIYDNLYAGAALYTPYGSGITWGDAWPGAVLNQSVKLKVFTLQPTLSWAVTDRLSIGAGLTINWGNVDLHKGLVSPQSMERLLTLQYEAARLQAATQGQQLPVTPDQGGEWRYGNTPPASVALQGSSELVLGYNVGAFFKVSDRVNVGANFRSKMKMHVKAGDASVAYANDLAAAVLAGSLDILGSANFEASMPCPYVLSLGATFKPLDKLLLAFDAQLTGWGTYDYLDFAFESLPAFDQHLKKDYKDSWAFKLGAQYAMTPRLDLRAGLMIDTSPCNKDYYNPETPGMTKIEPTVGLSFRPLKGLSIDVAFMYVKGCGVDGATGQYDNFLAPAYNNGLADYNKGVAAFNAALAAMGRPAYQGADLRPMEKAGTFTANYRLHALIPALGISYAF